MNKWKAYGSVSDLVKQFENTPSHTNTDLKKSQSLENIKKLQNFKTIYDKFENKDPETNESPLKKRESTNHLECLQLQEINQARKKLYEISGKLNNNSDIEAYAFYLKELSQLILDVGNVFDYGHAAIKSEKALILPLLHRYYMHIRDKLKKEGYNFEENDSVKGWVAKVDSVGQKSSPIPSTRLKKSNSDVIKGGNGNVTRKMIQRKYDKNTGNSQVHNSNQDSPKNLSNISRKISKLQSSINQDTEVRPKNKLGSQQIVTGNTQNKRNTWDGMSTANITNRFKYPADTTQQQNDKNNWENFSSNSSIKSFYTARSVDDYAKDTEKTNNGISNGGRPKPFYPSNSYDGRIDNMYKWDNVSNSSGSGQHRSSWNSFASQDFNSNQDKYETESDTASIISGNDIFEQKYSGIAERINRVLKKRISLLEEDGLLNQN